MMAFFAGYWLNTCSSVGDSVGAGAWDSASGFGMSTTTRWGRGRSIDTTTPASGLAKDGGPNSATWFITFALLQQNINLTAQFVYVGLTDGGTLQCTLTMEGDGSFRLRSGANGAVLATWSSPIVLNSFDHYQFKITINNTTGSIEGRKNGGTSGTFLATGLNTRGGTANNYANGFRCNTNGTGTRATFKMQDILVYDSSGATPNDWVGDVCSIMMMPVSDTATKQLTQNSTGSLSFGQSVNTGTRAFSAGTIQTTQLLSATQGGTMASVTVEFNANFTGKAKAALYLADGDLTGFLTDSKPGTLVAVSNEVVNPTTGLNTFSFASAVGVMAGFKYFIALITDGTATSKATTSNVTCYTYATTYVAGFPSSLANLTSQVSQTAPTIYAPSGVLTATNAGCVSEEIQDALTTYLSSSTLNNVDHYNLEALPYNPAFIVGLNFVVIAEKTDAGARGMKIEIASGGTTVQTTEFSLTNGTFKNFSAFYNTDPNTSTAWTTSGANAIQPGPLVST